MQLFTDPLHDEFAAWSTGYVTSGGADLGELEAIAASFGPGPTMARSSTCGLRPATATLRRPPPLLTLATARRHTGTSCGR